MSFILSIFSALSPIFNVGDCVLLRDKELNLIAGIVKIEEVHKTEYLYRWWVGSEYGGWAVDTNIRPFSFIEKLGDITECPK